MLTAILGPLNQSIVLIKIIFGIFKPEVEKRV